MSEADRCLHCRTPLSPGAEWCPHCFTRRAAEVELPQPPFAHPDAYLGPPPPVGYSRWIKSDISFGPLGRIVASALLLIPLWWNLMYSFVGAALWLFVVMPVALRSIWKRIPLRD